ncbi:hypothetical protein DL766_001114 [Monosporascus sp. MC13-8B]|nr:hypothetical protein DL763_005301 [Monosporascus cannonballus]RYP38204.1 hypothetical protein DL766_001114 [Monosporascus sp. MC13-8B]
MPPMERADASDANNNGWTTLDVAARNGDVAVVKLLLDKGTDPNVANNDGWTPLNLAAKNGHDEAVRLLLDKNADAIVKLFLDNGIDTNVANNKGWTPLYLTIINVHVEVVKLLLNRNADANIATRNGWTPLHVAVSNGHVEVVKLLLQGSANVDQQDARYGQTALIYAARGVHQAVVELLLEYAANPNLSDNIGRTPLSFAAQHGNKEALIALLSNECTIPDAKGHYGSTPLSIASRNSCTEIVELLLATDSVDVASRDRFGWTPLQWARRVGSADIERLLLGDVDKGSSLCHSDISTEERLTANSPASRYCDICTLSIEERVSYYQYRVWSILATGWGIVSGKNRRQVPWKTRLEKHELDALDAIWSRPYWGRVWMIPELALSPKDPLIGCGDTRISLNAFRFAESAYVKGYAGLDRHAFWNQLWIRAKFQAIREVDFGLDLFELLTRTRNFDCTEEKDRLRAVSGLLSKKDRSAILPDPEAEYQTIIKNAARLLLQKDLRILSRCSWPYLPHEIPSKQVHQKGLEVDEILESIGPFEAEDFQKPYKNITIIANFAFKAHRRGRYGPVSWEWKRRHRIGISPEDFCNCLLTGAAKEPASCADDATPFDDHTRHAPYKRILQQSSFGSMHEGLCIIDSHGIQPYIIDLANRLFLGASHVRGPPVLGGVTVDLTLEVKLSGRVSWECFGYFCA